MLKNLLKMSDYLSRLWTNISSIKRIVYQAKKFSIQSLFISIWFEKDRIAHAWLNMAVTYSFRIIFPVVLIGLGVSIRILLFGKMELDLPICTFSKIIWVLPIQKFDQIELFKTILFFVINKFSLVWYRFSKPFGFFLEIELLLV